MPYRQTGPSFSRQGGSKSLSTSSSRSIDYSGLDEHVQRQDAVASARDAKKAALYGGDPMQAMLAGNRVRELVSLLSRDAPGTTEQNPHVLKSPLTRVTSQSGSFSASSNPGGSSYSAPGYEYAPEEKKQPAPAPPPPEEPAPIAAPAPAEVPDEPQPPAVKQEVSEPPVINQAPKPESQAARYRRRLAEAMYS